MPAQPAVLRREVVGDVQLSFLPDGEIHQPVDGMYGPDAVSLFADDEQLLDEQGLLVMSLGAVLIETPRRRLLVDLGWGPTRLDLSSVGDRSRRGLLVGGELLASLAWCGLGVADIDLVVFTHLHADHIGWLLDDAGVLTFPRARYALAGPEWQHWLARVGDGSWGGPTDAQMAALSGRVELLDDGAGLGPGVSFAWALGHTPGHGSVVIDSLGRRAIVLGDAMHCPLELSDSRLRLRTDVDPAESARTREWVRAELAAGSLVVGPHFAGDIFARKGERC